MTTLFVGLGRMGAPMVRRHAALHETVVYDVDLAVASALAAEVGSRALPDLGSVDPGVDTVILMLPDSVVVESVLLDAGLLAQLGHGALVIDMGSSEPASTRRLAETASSSGVGYVDAPVSGGVSRAETGQLAIMVGGEGGDVARAWPHLEPLGENIVHVGISGTGHAAKALNNLLSATNLAAAAEVLCLAQREGIDPEVMVSVLNSSTGRSQATEVKYPQHVLTGTFTSGFAMDLMLKDLAIAQRLAQQPAEEPGAPAQLTMPITSTTYATLTEARRVLGREGMDHTEIVKYYEQMNQAHLRRQHHTDRQPDTERTHR